MYPISGNDNQIEFMNYHCQKLIEKLISNYKDKFTHQENDDFNIYSLDNKKEYEEFFIFERKDIEKKIDYMKYKERHVMVSARMFSLLESKYILFVNSTKQLSQIENIDIDLYNEFLEKIMLAHANDIVSKMEAKKLNELLPLADKWIEDNKQFMILNEDGSDFIENENIIKFFDGDNWIFKTQNETIVELVDCDLLFVIKNTDKGRVIYGESRSYGMKEEQLIDENFDWDENCTCEKWLFLNLKHIGKKNNQVAKEQDGILYCLSNKMYTLQHMLQSILEDAEVISNKYDDKKDNIEFCRY